MEISDFNISYKGLSERLVFSSSCTPVPQNPEFNPSHGGYGEIESAIYPDGSKNGILVAKKTLQRVKEFNYQFFREVDISNCLRHPCFIDFVGFNFADLSEDQSLHLSPFILTKYLKMGDLNIRKPNATEAERIKIEKVEKKLDIIFYGIARGLRFMHSLNFFHRDIKPDNVLLDDNFYPKIMDFGLSRKLNEENDQLSLGPGTPSFKAPEIIKRKSYSYPADVFSLGMLIYFCIEGDSYFEKITSICRNELRKANLHFENKDQYQHALCSLFSRKLCENYKKRNYPTISDDKNKKKYGELLRKMWEYRPHKRPSLKEVCDIIETIIEHEPLLQGEFSAYKKQIDEYENKNMPAIRQILSMRMENGKSKSDLFTFFHISNENTSRYTFRIHNHALSDDPHCLHAMGLVYFYGRPGIPSDLVAAYKFFLRASVNFHRESQALLSIMDNERDELLQTNPPRGLYYQGMIEEAKGDYKHAARSYLESSKYDIPEAIGRLGLLISKHFNNCEEKGQELILTAIHSQLIDQNILTLLYYHLVLLNCNQGKLNEAKQYCEILKTRGYIEADTINQIIDLKLASQKYPEK